MDDRDYIIILYDYYCELFNDKQREYFEEYYFNNLSLGEISENLDISRNAVHKAIKNMVDKLYFYEDKLRIYSKSRKINEIIDGLNDEDVKKKLSNVLESD